MLSGRLRQFFRRVSLRAILLALLFVFLPVFFFLFFAFQAGGAADVVTYRLGERRGNAPIVSVGSDLIPHITDAAEFCLAFEPQAFRKSLRITSGDDREMMVSAQDGLDIPLDAFFDGARVEVYRRLNGRQTLLKEGRIRECIPDRLSPFYPFYLPPDTPDQLEWESFAGGGSRIAAISRQGYFLSGIGSADPRLLRLPDGVALAGLAGVEDQFFLLDGMSRVWKSAGDRLEAIELPRKASLSVLAARADAADDQLILAGREGLIFRGVPGHFSEEKMPASADVMAAAAGDAGFYLLNADGDLYFSAEKGKWDCLLEGNPEKPSTKLAVFGRTLLLAGSQNDIYYSRDAGADFERLKIAELPPAESVSPTPFDFDRLRQIAILSADSFCLLDEQGEVLESHDAGATWQIPAPRLLPLLPESFYADPSGKLLVSGGGKELYSAQIGTRIILEEALADGRFKAGDILVSEQLSTRYTPSLRSDPGHALLSGEQLSAARKFPDVFISSNAEASLDMDERLPDGGRTSLKISAPSAHSAATDLGYGLYRGESYRFSSPSPSIRLAVPLPRELSRSLAGQTSFSLDFSAKAEAESALVRVTLGTEQTGNSDHRERVLSTRWQKENCRFIFDHPLREEDELLLLFELPEGGSFSFDQIRLKAEEIDDLFECRRERLSSTGGGILRFDDLRIGDRKLPSEFWLSRSRSDALIKGEPGWLSAGSLYESARLCELTAADPWLVIRPWVSPQELRRLMQYMFAKTDLPYGAIRMEQGMPARFSDLFPEIYLEFTEDEDDDFFSSDRDRAAYMDWALQFIRQTPEYQQMASQIVLVDGLLYQEGEGSSGADARAIDGDARRFLRHWDTMSPTLPDESLSDPPLSPDGSPKPLKIVRSLSWGEGEDLRFCEKMGALLQALSAEASVCLLQETSPYQASEGDFRQMLELGDQIEGAMPLRVYRESDRGSEPPPAFAFQKEDELYIFVLNTGRSALLAQFPSGLPGDVRLQSFDLSGKLLEERMLRHGNSAFPVYPGGLSFLIADAP